jgi:tetratricopeptide (TPR) repeat protein
MSNSVSKELAHVKELINKWKIEEALQYVKGIEQMENLTNEETLRILYYKGQLYRYLGQLKFALKFAKQLYQKSQESKMSLFSLDALYLKSWVFFGGGPPGEYSKNLDQYETLFSSIPRVESLEFQRREADLLLHRATGCYYKGNLDLSLKFHEKSLAIYRQVDPNSIDMIWDIIGMAYVYHTKGELDRALECNEKALSLIPDRENFPLIIRKSTIYRSMGIIYFEKGELTRALEYHLLELEILTKIKYNPGVPDTYANIIKVLLAQKDNIQARKYLQQFKNFIETHEHQEGLLIYEGLVALVLKSSSRLKDRAEAGNMTKKLIEKCPSTSFIRIFALVNLCEWYFEEFQLSHEVEVLDDIQPLIDQLQRNARVSNSYSFLANVKLLQAKLALLQVNMVEARILLTEAQKIADEHDLQLLAGEISREHDHLLEELKLWESIKREQASVAERLKLVSVDPIMERLQGRRAIEIPEVNIEEPILLIIMDKSGITYFNHSFIGDWDFEDLFSSFMSAFNAFSGEIFSRSIDRIKIGENTILINPIEPFLACYVIKGQSYPAQQKLTQFSDTIKATTEIWDALNRAAKTSEMLEIDNPPSLGTTMKEIFIN